MSWNRVVGNWCKLQGQARKHITHLKNEHSEELNINSAVDEEYETLTVITEKLNKYPDLTKKSLARSKSDKREINLDDAEN